MLLVEEREENGWIRSTFNLTYRVTWDQLLQAVHGAYPYFANPQVLVDGTQISVAKQSDILTIPEDRAIILRGISTVLNAPLMITFRNQSQAVAVSVGSVNQEFRNTTYEKYNKSMSQLMDSMEIMMHLHAAKPNGSSTPPTAEHPHTFGEQRRERSSAMYLEDNTSIAAGFGQRSR